MRTRELKRLEKKLLQRKEQIEANLEDRVKSTRSLNEDEANDDADLAFVSADSWTGSAIAQQQVGELEEINYALNKIKDNTYGVCEMCEDNISLERLRVKPFAKYCIDCREIVEKNPKK